MSEMDCIDYMNYPPEKINNFLPKYLDYCVEHTSNNFIENSNAIHHPDHWHTGLCVLSVSSGTHFF